MCGYNFSKNALIEDHSYLYLFQDIGETARERMRNLAKHNYGIDGTESAAVLVLKKFIKQRVNEEYYPGYLAGKIVLAKSIAQSNADWKARASSRAAEAEKQLLAELEAETRTKQQTQKNQAAKKSKGKKK